MSDDITNPGAPALAPSSTTLFPLVDDYSKRGNTLIVRTLDKLNEHGHIDSDLHLKIRIKLLETVDAIHEVMAKANKIAVDDNGVRCLPLTALNLIKQLWKKTGVYLIFLGKRKKVGAAFSESEGGFYFRIMKQFDEKEQELEDDNAFVCITLDEMLQLSKENPGLKEKVMALMKICPAFSGFYDDKEGQNREKLFEHCLIAVFESYFAFVIDGNDPGYIAERILNLGSEDIWRYLKMPSSELNKKAIKWLSVLPKDVQVYVLETWETYISAIRASIREKGMTDSDEVMAMLQDDLFQWYLNRHTLFSIWGDGGPDRSGTCFLGEEPFPDAVSCPIFADVEDVAGSILQVMEDLKNGQLIQSQAKSQFKSLLSGITTKHTKQYVAASDEALRAGGEKMLSSLIDAARAQSKGGALITTEQFLVDKFDKDYWGNITRGAETCDVYTTVKKEGKPTTAGTLYRIPLDGKHCKTLLIFVGCSPHVTLGHGNTMPQRLSQASKQIATSSVLEEAGLIDKGSTNKLTERFRFFFINVEGPFGNLLWDGVVSNRDVRFYFAVQLSLPPGYYIPPIRKGIVALANEICPGMLKHHAIALMVVMGYEQFCNFLQLHCDLDLGPVEQLKERLEEMSRQRQKQLAKHRRLAFDEILKVLQKKAEERTEEDFENLEESRALIRTRKTSQEYDGAKMLVMTLTENPTNDDITEVAEGVYNILTNHVTGQDCKSRKLRRFYLVVASDFEESVINGLFGATLLILRRERFGGETNANPFQAPSAAVEELID